VQVGTKGSADCVQAGARESAGCVLAGTGELAGCLWMGIGDRLSLSRKSGLYVDWCWALAVEGKACTCICGLGLLKRGGWAAWWGGGGKSGVGKRILLGVLFAGMCSSI